MDINLLGAVCRATGHKVCIQTSANMINKKIFFQKCNIGIKNAELDADFESVEKVAENIKRKKLSMKK